MKIPWEFTLSSTEARGYRTLGDMIVHMGGSSTHFRAAHRFTAAAPNARVHAAATQHSHEERIEFGVALALELREGVRVAAVEERRLFLLDLDSVAGRDLERGQAKTYECYSHLFFLLKSEFSGR